MIKNIYIIDDDPDDQELLIEALHEIDSEVLYFKADDGYDGLQKLHTIDFPRPDLNFVDLNMPRINGRQFLNQIKQDVVLKDIPIIIYSTSYDEPEVKDLIKSGAAYFLKKPYSFEDLKIQLQLLLIKKFESIRR